MLDKRQPTDLQLDEIWRQLCTSIEVQTIEKDEMKEVLIAESQRRSSVAAESAKVARDSIAKFLTLGCPRKCLIQSVLLK